MTKHRFIINDSTGTLQRAPECYSAFLWFVGVGIFVLGVLVGKLWFMVQMQEVAATMVR